MHANNPHPRLIFLLFSPSPYFVLLNNSKESWLLERRVSSVDVTNLDLEESKLIRSAEKRNSLVFPVLLRFIFLLRCVRLCVCVCMDVSRFRRSILSSRKLLSHINSKQRMAASGASFFYSIPLFFKTLHKFLLLIRRLYFFSFYCRHLPILLFRSPFLLPTVFDSHYFARQH